MSEEPGRSMSEKAEALEATWPRALIAEGLAGPLAVFWVESRNNAVRDGFPPFARHPMNAKLAEGLFHARRARRLVRGLEGAGASLAAQEAGLKKVAASAGGEPSRISRLLIVSHDGSERFFREVEKLQRRFGRRLAVLVIDCDQTELGEASFGPGKQARALLIDHKEAVIRFLVLLDGVQCD